MWINLRISTKFLQISPETLKSHQILTKIGHLVGFLTFFPKSDHCSVLAEQRQTEIINAALLTVQFEFAGGVVDVICDIV